MTGKFALPIWWRASAAVSEQEPGGPIRDRATHLTIQYVALEADVASDAIPLTCDSARCGGWIRCT